MCIRYAKYTLHWILCKNAWECMERFQMRERFSIYFINLLTVLVYLCKCILLRSNLSNMFSSAHTEDKLTALCDISYIITILIKAATETCHSQSGSFSDTLCLLASVLASLHNTASPTSSSPGATWKTTSWWSASLLRCTDRVVLESDALHMV